MEKEQVEQEIARISHDIKEAESRLQAIQTERNKIDGRKKAVLDAQRKVHTWQLKLGQFISHLQGFVTNAL